MPKKEVRMCEEPNQAKKRILTADGLAIIIATCALGVSLWSGWVTWDHNKKSVRPILQIGPTYSPDNKLYYVSVSNSGIGPAIIKKSFFYYRGKLLGQIDTHSIKQFSHLVGLNEKVIRGREYLKEVIISAGDEYEVISPSVNRDDLKNDRFKKGELNTINSSFYESLREVSLEICYCSLYDECWQSSWERDPSDNSTSIIVNKSIKSCD